MSSYLLPSYHDTAYTNIVSRPGNGTLGNTDRDNLFRRLNAAVRREEQELLHGCHETAPGLTALLSVRRTAIHQILRWCAEWLDEIVTLAKERASSIHLAKNAHELPAFDPGASSSALRSRVSKAIEAQGEDYAKYPDSNGKPVGPQDDLRVRYMLVLATMEWCAVQLVERIPPAERRWGCAETGIDYYAYWSVFGVSSEY